jgi:hypothetical protein
LAALAENDAANGILDDRAVLAVFLLQLVYVHVAIVDASATVYAFLVVYCWSPRDFISGYAVICF